MVATVALKGSGFIAEVKAQRDCRVVEVRPEEREAILTALRQDLLGRLGDK